MKQGKTGENADSVTQTELQSGEHKTRSAFCFPSTMQKYSSDHVNYAPFKSSPEHYDRLLNWLGSPVIADTSLTSCDTSVGVEASRSDGEVMCEVTEVDLDCDSENPEISIGNVRFFLNVSHASVFLEMCKKGWQLITPAWLVWFEKEKKKRAKMVRLR